MREIQAQEAEQDGAEECQPGEAAEDRQRNRPPALAAPDLPRERERPGRAGQEEEERKDDVMMIEPDSGMMRLRGQRRRESARQCDRQRTDDIGAADQPPHVPSAQDIDGKDATLGLFAHLDTSNGLPRPRPSGQVRGRPSAFCASCQYSVALSRCSDGSTVTSLR